MPMTKQQAAEYLGVTIRSIEAYASKGKLTPMRAKGTRGDITVYNEEELAKLKAEREQISFTNPFATSLVARQQIQPIPQQPVNFGQILASPEMRDLISEILKTVVKEGVKHWIESNTADKLALSLKEASDLSGLSTTTLRNDIHAGELKAKIIGRGWKIRRADLDRYMNQVWKE